MSKWNAFQSAHAGQGLSSSQMSAMYHASNSSSSGGGSSSSSSGGGSSSYSSGSSSYSSSIRSSASSSYSPPARTAPAPAPAPAPALSWNAYQQAHAGQGLSRAEMSAGYQASKARSSTPSTPSTASAIASRPASVTSSANAWNEYQRAHAGKGLSPSDMSSGYKAAQASTTTSSTTARSTPSTRVSNSGTGSSSSWNEFQRQNAGKGLTARQMSLLYQREQPTPPTESTASSRSKGTKQTPRESDASVAKQTRRPNAFNDFQKQYKQDHPDEKLNAAQLANLYREKQFEQQRRAELEPKPSDAPLAERIRRQTEEMLYNLGMMQLEQDMCSSERDEWRCIAQQLERDEGNYNRQLFVEAHGQTPEWGAADVSALETCELIEAERIKLDDDKRLGSGECSAVYSAVVDKTIPVAVKVIDGVNSKSKTRFEQELLAMMKASAHENVLRVFGYTVLPSKGGRQSYGIIMELMGGGDLAFVLHRDESVDLQEDARLDILLQVIKAIEYIHSQGITHRDIKPHNVLLSSDRKTAKLADFGLSGFKNTTLSTQQSHTSSTKADNALPMSVGLTPAYAAPEVIEGTLSFRDAAWRKSDVFSFTVLLTEVLLQEQPWESESPQFITNSVSKHNKRPFGLSDLVVFGNAENTKLRSLVEGGWHQDPAKRPTATQMREQLEEIIAAVKRARASAPSPKPSSEVRSRPTSPRGVDGS